MTKVLLGSTILVGVNGSIETYVSQAAGAKEKKLAGTYLNQGRIILCFFFIPIALILSCTEKTMVMLGQDKEVAQYAQQFVVMSLPSVVLSGLNDSQKKFLNCFKKNYVPMVTNAVNVLLYPVILYIFVFQLNLGIVGLAMTDNISTFLTLLCNLVYTWTLEDL